MPLALFRRPFRLPPRHGLTLVELVVAMAVLVVMLAMAAPRMSDFSANNQLVALKSNVAGAVALARTEATRRGLPVVLVPEAGGSEGNEYAMGWALVADDNSDGAAGDTETRLRTQGALPAGLTLGGPAKLVFRASGALSVNTAQVFKLCRGGSSKGYSVTVVPSGATDVASITSCGG